VTVFRLIARNAYTFIIGKTEGKRRIQKDDEMIILKRIIKIIGYEDANCIIMLTDRIQ
jgi:hypothetical protein